MIDILRIVIGSAADVVRRRAGLEECGYARKRGVKSGVNDRAEVAYERARRSAGATGLTD